MYDRYNTHFRDPRILFVKEEAEHSDKEKGERVVEGMTTEHFESSFDAYSTYVTRLVGVFVIAASIFLLYYGLRVLLKMTPVKRLHLGGNYYYVEDEESVIDPEL